MTDPIRAALDKAAEAICPTGRTTCGPCAPLCSHCLRIAANAIASFNHALPGHLLLAQAVLAAAKEAKHER